MSQEQLVNDLFQTVMSFTIIRRLKETLLVMPSSTVLDIKVNELYEADAESKRRLREIEQRLKAIDNSVKRVEAGFTEIKNKLLEISTSLKSDKGALDSKIKTLENTISDIINNMKRLAEKSEIIAIKELLDIYSPVKSQFVTREEVENMIEENKGRDKG